MSEQHKNHVDPSPKAFGLRHVLMSKNNYSAYHSGILAAYGASVFLRIIWQPDTTNWFNSAVRDGIVFG